MQRESVNSFKQELINILIKNNYDSSKIIDNLSRATCHMTLIDAFVQICLLNRYRVILENVYKNYKEMFDRQLNASELIPFVSSVNEYQLVLLSNSFDILKGNQIVSDYLNNIFICNDNINVEQGGIISCRFIKSFKNYFFDLNINKKIFFTNKSGSCIYIFKKQKGRYLFTGIYKCFKLTIGNDLKGNPTPIFKFHSIDNNSYVNHINYLRQLTVSNGYKNVFNDVINKNEDL